MMPDNVQQFLLNENIRLATEVDLLSADLKYLREVMTTMSKLLAQAEVPVPSEELAMLAKRHDERVANIVNMSTAISQFQQSLIGMRTGEESAGMRTGKPVTNEDVENILKQIDPTIVKKMGE